MSDLTRIGEFGLIERIRRSGKDRDFPGILCGIGDDAALLRPPSGMDLLVTTDLMIESVHFDLAWTSFHDLGFKAAAANLSDIAAMGGEPKFLFVSLALPSGIPIRAVEEFYRGLRRGAGRGVAVAGGDTSASKGGLFINIAMLGVVERGVAVRRSGAAPGDLLYVTGTLGDAAAGLEALRRGETEWEFLVRRHLRPTARTREGRRLARHRIPSAMIDVSDGLSSDLLHLTSQSEVGARIEAERLPLSRALRRYAAARRIDPLRFALHGGEDYELLFTVSPRKEHVLARAKISARRIGRIVSPREGVALVTGGTPSPLSRLGYEHFRKESRP